MPALWTAWLLTLVCLFTVTWSAAHSRLPHTRCLFYSECNRQRRHQVLLSCFCCAGCALQGIWIWVERILNPISISGTQEPKLRWKEIVQQVRRIIANMWRVLRAILTLLSDFTSTWPLSFLSDPLNVNQVLLPGCFVCAFSLQILKLQDF